MEGRASERNSEMGRLSLGVPLKGCLGLGGGMKACGFREQHSLHLFLVLGSTCSQSGLPLFYSFDVAEEPQVHCWTCREQVEQTMEGWGKQSRRILEASPALLKALVLSKTRDLFTTQVRVVELWMRTGCKNQADLKKINIYDSPEQNTIMLASKSIFIIK